MDKGVVLSESSDSEMLNAESWMLTVIFITFLDLSSRHTPRVPAQVLVCCQTEVLVATYGTYVYNATAISRPRLSIHPTNPLNSPISLSIHINYSRVNWACKDFILLQSQSYCRFRLQ
jgi:hypothetical protein